MKKELLINNIWIGVEEVVQPLLSRWLLRGKFMSSILKPSHEGAFTKRLS